MPYSPNLVSFPTLDAECHDTEARSLKKITDLLFTYIYGSSGTAPPASLADLVSAIKGEDAVLATSGAFVGHFTLFTGATLLWQLDAFSIATALRWVFIQDSATVNLGLMPLYIAPIYPNSSTSFMVTAPFKNGVTVTISTSPSTIVEDTANPMLVTGVRRG